MLCVRPARRMSGNGESPGKEWDVRMGKLRSTLLLISGGAGSFPEWLPRSGVVRAGGVQVESKPLQVRGDSPVTA